MTSSRLTALLNELGDCLQAASDSGTSPQGSELQLHARIRTVLVSLFAECIDTKTGWHDVFRALCAVCRSCTASCHTMVSRSLMLLWMKEYCSDAVKDKDLISLLNLINMALEKFRRIVRDDNGVTVFTIMGQTIHLLAEERLRYVIPYHQSCSFKFDAL